MGLRVLIESAFETASENLRENVLHMCLYSLAILCFVFIDSSWVVSCLCVVFVRCLFMCGMFGVLVFFVVDMSLLVCHYKYIYISFRFRLAVLARQHAVVSQQCGYA